jgi:histidinol-phosphate aminotransferase
MPDRFSRRLFFAAGAAVTAATSWRGVARATPADGAAPPASQALSADRSPQLIRLSANENPYGPSPLARAALVAAAGETCRYPIALAADLTAKLAAREAVPRDHIVLGAGSAELLATLALGVAPHGPVVCAWPTFEWLPDYAARRGAPLRKVPLDAGMRHDLPALAAAVTPDTALLYVCNPNNPTGTAVPGPALRAFCEAMSRTTLVVVDEAYLDLIEPGATESMVDLVRAGRNLVVLRTFSKIHGLAGLRVGYAIAPPGVATTLRGAATTLVPSASGLRAALASLDDAAFLTQTRDKLVADRRRIRQACEGLGLACAESEGNFLFFDVGLPVDTFRARLRAMNIEVGRRFDPFQNWCRVTVGTSAETDAFLAALPRALAREG